MKREAMEVDTGRIAVDIGSTVVKVARIDPAGRIVDQKFFPRDFDAGIAAQVRSLLTAAGEVDPDRLLMCSSANGGLRVGIVSLTSRFSGAALRNQVLLAGGNPIFVHDLDETSGHPARVDLLLVGGGIDCEDAAPMRDRLERFAGQRYSYGSLVYAGNRYLAPVFGKLHPQAVVIPNPIGDSLSGRSLSVFEAVRRAYLDDLVYKEGVSELGTDLAARIRPTPDVVSQGFQRAVSNESSVKAVGASLLLDVGGATTDLHYTVEIVRDDSESRPSSGSSVARYVFTDLGIVASRESLLLQLRNHPRLYEFIGCVQEQEVRETYRLLREGEHSVDASLLSYGCLFIALHRFTEGRGPGLPTADLDKVTQILLTGGAVQALAPASIQRVFRMFTRSSSIPDVFIDRAYQIWVEGITWRGQLSSARSATLANPS